MNSDEIRSPHIDHISWGHMEVAGLGVGKDFKLWPGGGREWNWRETDTHHVPGIQPSDVLMLRTCQETIDQLEEMKISLHIAETKAAAEIYNDLASGGKAVGGLFHSTC